MLMSGAWKTWMSLLSYAYTNEMTFAPLQTSTCDSGPVVDAEVQQPQRCSPRSMYSLATAVGFPTCALLAALTVEKLGIKNIEEKALSNIRSKLSTSNITRELFTSFAASHKAVMDMEIQFFHENFTEEDPKLLMDHIRRMGSGEVPLFSTTLSLVYDKLVENAFTQPISSSSALEKSTSGQSVTEPAPPLQVTNSISSIGPSSTPDATSPSSLQVPIPTPGPVPSGSTDRVAWLECMQCGELSRLKDLYDGLRCPLCPERSTKKGRPFMQCQLCSIARGTHRGDCIRRGCRATFV
ncbi:hypothetical protein BDM02DRAFT_1689789 [Thelephora ganbajun]|uniref:Uncharacterized protein n=1 Tax=Thelephora ganbajun TaxID=370292 RepID=A0ACB6ZJM0_THEGA|nr:hypothetical protein BDM02DRAFT_1689789 [Thelephora ganbajun]